MNEVITRVINENCPHMLAEIPPELLNEDELEVVKFVMEYASRHGRPPSIKRVMEEHETFIPFKFMASRWEEEEAPLSDVIEQTIKRKLNEASTRLLRQAQRELDEDGETPIETLHEIERLHVMSLGVNRFSRFDRESYFRRSVMELPFKVINKHIGGISDGDFTLLVGRLGTGKSTIAQYISFRLWEAARRILYVSAEMPGGDVFSRIDAMVGKFNPLELRGGRTDEMAEKLSRVFARVSGEPGEIIVPKNRLISPLEIAGFAQNLQVDLIVIDGAYLLQPSNGTRTNSRWEKVATVSNEIKQMALELNKPVIATAQIKRGANADDYTPEDIALSDALGQDADFVIALKQNQTMKERLELQLIKNRYGSNCATQLNLNFDTMTVVDETVDGAVEDAPPESWKDFVR